MALGLKYTYQLVCAQYNYERNVSHISYLPIYQYKLTQDILSHIQGNENDGVIGLQVSIYLTGYRQRYTYLRAHVSIPITYMLNKHL